MATRAHAIVYKVKASHVAMISQPAATLRAIFTAATVPNITRTTTGAGRRCTSTLLPK